MLHVSLQRVNPEKEEAELSFSRPAPNPLPSAAAGCEMQQGLPAIRMGPRNRQDTRIAIQQVGHDNSGPDPRSPYPLATRRLQRLPDDARFQQCH